MNQATYNADFPPYSIPSTSIQYPQTPTIHSSALLPHSQQMTPIRTRTRPDNLPNGPPRDSETTRGPLPTKVPGYPAQPHSKEISHTVSRKRTRNIESKKIQMQKKKIHWMGETLTTSKRFSTLTEETTNEAPATHADHKPPPIFISGVANIKPLFELLNAIASDKYLVKTLSNQ